MGKLKFIDINSQQQPLGLEEFRECQKKIR